MKNFLKKFKNILIISGIFVVIMVINALIPRNSVDDSKLMPISVTGTLVIFISALVLFAVLLAGLFFIARSKKSKKQKEEYKGVLCAAVSIVVEILCVLLTISSNIFGLYGFITSIAFYGCMIAAFSSFDSITFEVKEVQPQEVIEVQSQEVIEVQPHEVIEVQPQEVQEETPAAVEESIEVQPQEVQEEKKPATTKPVAKKPATSRSKKVDYNKLTIPELKELAKQKGISGYSKLKKQELIDVLSKPKPRKKTK